MVAKAGLRTQGWACRNVVVRACLHARFRLGAYLIPVYCVLCRNGLQGILGGEIVEQLKLNEEKNH